MCEEKLGGVSELSATLYLYLDGYEPLSSKYPSLHLLVEFLSELSFSYHFTCVIIVRSRDGCSSLMAQVLDGVGARAVIDSVDVVSRLEVTFVCIPSPRCVGVGSRW